MIYDAAAKSNKLSPFSGIWNWIVGKLTNAVISNLRTNNQTMIGAINEVNGSLPAGGIYDLDNPPKKMIFSARAGSTNLPNNFNGANAVTVIQMNLGNDSYDSMIAFTFAVDKIAIRRKNGTKNWSKWEYFNTAEILSNLTTTNKSSLVGAINELNSNTRFNVTVPDNVSIANNVSIKVGRVVYLAVKLKITGVLSSEEVLRFSDNAANESTTFMIGKGMEWYIDGIIYGYLNRNSVVISGKNAVSIGDYLHISTVLIL